MEFDIPPADITDIEIQLARQVIQCDRALKGLVMAAVVTVNGNPARFVFSSKEGPRGRTFNREGF